MTKELAPVVPLGPFGAVNAAIDLATRVAEAVATVDAVLKILEDGADELRGVGMTQFEASHFGASWAGNNLGGHGVKAQTNIIEQLDQLATGLRQYREDLVLSGKDTQQTDEGEDQRYRGIEALTACVTSDFSSVSGDQLDNSCAPGGGS